MGKIYVALAAILLIAMPASARSSSDFQVFKAVEEQVLRYPHYSIFDSVHAQVDDGVVTLTGRVTMPHKRVDLERRVAKAMGVTTVRNELQLLPVSPFDDSLRWRIARAIYSSSNFRHYGSAINPPIHILVERGRVTLEGVVNNEADRRVAYAIAGQFPAFSFTNALKTVAEARAELENL